VRAFAGWGGYIFPNALQGTGDTASLDPVARLT